MGTFSGSSCVLWNVIYIFSSKGLTKKKRYTVVSTDNSIGGNFVRIILLVTGGYLFLYKHTAMSCSPARSSLRPNRRARVGRPPAVADSFFISQTRLGTEQPTTKSGKRETPLSQGHDRRLSHNVGVRSTEWQGTFSFVSRSSSSGGSGVVRVKSELRNSCDTEERYLQTGFPPRLAPEADPHSKSFPDEYREGTAYTAPAKPYSWGVSITHPRCREEYWTWSDNRGCG